jgi:isochorismate pyruvate lyase
MAEVRAGVDDVDEKLMALLARRFAFMAAAARIKTDRNMVRDEARKAEVIANARECAVALGVPEPLVANLWELLVENSISYEMQLFDNKACNSG